MMTCKRPDLRSTPDKELNILNFLIWNAFLYAIIYRSYKLLTMVCFFAYHV